MALTSSRVPKGEADLHLIGAWTRYSSWTARVTIALEAFQIPYSAEYINLFPSIGVTNKPDTPAGLVPALVVNSLNTTIHDSLAILEFLAETYPEKKLWPEDRALRALARSVANEMHAGFGVLRNNYHSNYLAKYPTTVPLAEGTEKELLRAAAIWERARAAAKEKKFGEKDQGFLFGDFSIADAMFWPVLWRIRTYNLPIADKLSEEGKNWIRTMWDSPVAQWIEEDIFRQAEDKGTVMPKYDNVFGPDCMEIGRQEKGWRPQF